MLGNCEIVFLKEIVRDISRRLFIMKFSLTYSLYIIAYFIRSIFW